MYWKLPHNKKFPTAPIVELKDYRKYVAPLNSNLDFFQLVTQGSNYKANLTGADIFLTCVCIAEERWVLRENVSMKGPTILNFLLERNRWNVFSQPRTSSGGDILSEMLWVMVHH